MSLYISPVFSSAPSFKATHYLTHACIQSRALLLAVLVLLAIGGETLCLQELSCSSSFAEGALVLIQESLLLFESSFLLCMEALELLKAALQLTCAGDNDRVTEIPRVSPL